jgi:hypothetical protein
MSESQSRNIVGKFIVYNQKTCKFVFTNRLNKNRLWILH